MKRIDVSPRDNWQKIVEAQGYLWHTESGHCCWREDACYVLASAEVELVLRTANELHALLLQAVAHVIENSLWQRFGIPENHARIIKSAWESGHRTMISRFDFLLDEDGQPKLLELNADGALTLLESAVIQREWQRKCMPEAGQCNELHASLVAAWKAYCTGRVHLAWRPRHPEVEGTMRYLARTAREAGLEAVLVAMHCIGYDSRQDRFVDREMREILHCCKLYPWAWMLNEPFACHLEGAATHFIEPAFAYLLGSKGLLPILWELFPDHPAILPCHAVLPEHGAYVSKPLFGCEGQNISLHGVAEAEATEGEFASQARVHQQFVRAGRHEGFLPQLGVWMIHGQAAGIGIREDTRLILHNDSTFVPHVVIG